ncbi:hypothetical protein [Frigoriglobus tundricola]|uniref:Uncharacterized protein n=1 Tax=Frigoriglobus tundricola TaxID=2774151 RepID=A0A6M5YLR2_9BACT|nr:hypothetical protein [Frigoriglobus tundricola]QJW94290.1 hypothetical protein FTUN_1810 [Frigoriglobus tundricola]
MSEDAKQKLDLRLVPAEGEPDIALLDDLVRLIKQGVVTAPKQAPQVNTTGEFAAAPDHSQNALETRIKHRIEQASNASEADVAKRAEIAKQPDGDARLAEEALAAAQNVVAAVQRAILRGIAVRVPDGA